MSHHGPDDTRMFQAAALLLLVVSIDEDEDEDLLVAILEGRWAGGALS